MREIELGGKGGWQIRDDRLCAALRETDATSEHRRFRLVSWGLEDGSREALGEVDWDSFDLDSKIFA